MSAKRKKQNAVNKPYRDQYLKDFPACMVCGSEATEVHEMTDGCNRDRALDKPEAVLSVCNPCNFMVLKDRKRMPLARQCAIKMLADPENFNLSVICEILGTDYRKCPNAVTLADVVEHLQLTPGDGNQWQLSNR